MKNQISPPHAVGALPGEGVLKTAGQRRRYLVLCLYAICLLVSGSYLFRFARWTATAGYGWLGPTVLTTALFLAAALVFIQVVRAVRRRRFLHILFLILIVLGFFPAYLNLRLPLERFHLMEYGLLGMLIFWTLSPRRYSLQFYLLCLNLLIVISFLDEVLQGLVPDRYYDLNDIWVNVFSGTIGVLLYRMTDLNAPLPLHPHFQKEHVGPQEPPPLIDLHIYKTDLLFLVPLLLILSCNFFLTRTVKTDEVLGTWAGSTHDGYTLEVRGDRKALVDFPDCSLVCDSFNLEGNLLDGFRLYLGCRSDLQEMPPACESAIPRSLSIRRDPLRGDLRLFAESTGTLARPSGAQK